MSKIIIINIINIIIINIIITNIIINVIMMTDYCNQGIADPYVNQQTFEFTCFSPSGWGYSSK